MGCATSQGKPCWEEAYWSQFIGYPGLPNKINETNHLPFPSHLNHMVLFPVSRTSQSTVHSQALLCPSSPRSSPGWFILLHWALPAAQMLLRNPVEAVPSAVTVCQHPSLHTCNDHTHVIRTVCNLISFLQWSLQVFSCPCAVVALFLLSPWYLPQYLVHSEWLINSYWTNKWTDAQLHIIVHCCILRTGYLAQ